jgi:hypothetical protein
VTDEAELASKIRINNDDVRKLHPIPAPMTLSRGASCDNIETCCVKILCYSESDSAGGSGNYCCLLAGGVHGYRDEVSPRRVTIFRDEETQNRRKSSGVPSWSTLGSV